ncbi:50S ribosomal protein L9 [bacterium]|nr:50S ribosomal protein L9 [bacterium]|tara:strand:+ start:24683 stop:25126 length:444 start_codon:yes stop_codon:yes gene_type:complete
MKIILKKDIAGLGLKSEVKEVANGYAQNFLIGRGFAEMATPAKVKHAEKQAAKRAAEAEAAKATLESALSKLKGKGLIIRATANEKDHLFEAVSAATIAAHLKDIVGVEVEASSIHTEYPIKALGEHMVAVIVGKDSVPVKIKIEST